VARSGAVLPWPPSGQANWGCVEVETAAKLLLAAHQQPGSVRFDVAAVRTYCERLVAEGERLAMERVVFADWTRARGMGPEAFDLVHEAMGSQHASWAGLGYVLAPQDRCGGWPGSLARGAGAQASECGCWAVRVPQPSSFDEPVHPLDEHGSWLGYILDTPRGPEPDPECRACRGTGHNLAGVLPAVEHPDPRVSRLYASASRAMASAVAVASFDIPRAVALARAGGLTEPLAPPPLFGPFTAAGEARLHRVSVAVALPAEIGGSDG
jgi:hypothetical protein